MKREKPSISQTISNSPGAVLAGRDVNFAPQPRRLSPRHQELLLQALTEAPRKDPVTITCFRSVFDSCRLANQFLDTFLESQWPDLREKQIGMDTSEPPVGIFLTARNVDAPAALNLQTILARVFGQPILIREDRWVAEGVVTLVIGSNS